MRAIGKTRRALTGLETAIIVIAFVIVASAFAFAMLNMGFLTSQKSTEVLQTGLQEAASAMEPDGSVIAYYNGTSVTQVELYIKLSAGKNPVDISNETLIIAYTDPYIHEENVYDNFNDENAVDSSKGSIIEIKGDGDNLLEYGEKFKVVINLPQIYSPDTVSLSANDYFRVELKPPVGSVLTFEKRLPASLDDVMILN